MRVLVELSAEHGTLPLAELRAVAALEGGRVASVDGPVALVEGADPAFLARRLALAHAVVEPWWSGPTADLVPALAGREAGGSFAVRPRRLEGAQPDVSLTDLARQLGAALRGRVDLRAPEVDVRVLLAGQAHAGRLLAEVDRRAFDARHVKHRAHFAPVSLHPRYARALVNLAGVRAGDRVADPFCGTGGLLLEAGLVGATALGGDLDPRMVAGTRAELARLGVAGARVEEHDVGELPEWAGPVDAVVSDPPYGRSSTTNREAMDRLYDRFLAAAREALRPGGRLAVIFPTDALRARAAETFRLVEAHDQRVHRSMTRHWGVFERA
ncbi:MAG TPA: methyltransferase domain-containing protein [Candidatus Thermoplasmatota archaeon]|nr:methyltransferase domain-containing protein [Candidatus Thermoplasmatota archaeon]